MTTWEFRQQYAALDAKVAAGELLTFHERVGYARLRRQLLRAEVAEKRRAREARRGQR